jgi:hypothetical protein
MTPEDIDALRETVSRLNRRAQQAEAAANVAAERWGLRSEKAGRSYVYRTGLDAVSRLREMEDRLKAVEAERDALRAALVEPPADLVALVRHVQRTHEEVQVAREDQGQRVIDDAALVSRTCGNCAHWRKGWPNVTGSETGECVNRKAMPWAARSSDGTDWCAQTTSDDGCIKGYLAGVHQDRARPETDTKVAS